MTNPICIGMYSRNSTLFNCHDEERVVVAVECLLDRYAISRHEVDF